MTESQSLQPTRPILLGIAVVTFSALLLEVVLTRIFSAVMYYHFTFFAIAIALLGLGASGVYVYIKADRFTADRANADIAQNARRFAGATILALTYMLANPILGLGANLILQVVLLNAALLLPFFFAGMVVSLAITHYSRHIDRVYFWDLCGAALAALVCGLLLGVFGGPTLMIVIALLALIGGVLVDDSTKGFRSRDAFQFAAVLLLLFGNMSWPLFPITATKSIDGAITFEKWNTFSRVTVVGRRKILIDASAATMIADARTIETREWEKDISALAHGSFASGSDHHTLVIGAGGGTDVVNALAAGAGRVTGVEVNPIIAQDIMQGDFVEENNRLYEDPRVKIVADEGRSYIRRSDEKYDVIQATLVDTWAATAAGAFMLTENTLYTLEAFDEFYDHLSDRGVFTMTRWSGEEDERLILLAATALVRRGVSSDQMVRHLFFARERVPVGVTTQGTLLAKAKPFTAEELERLTSLCERHNFEVLVSPSATGHRLAQLAVAGVDSEMVRNHPTDLSAPTDDRPFFFYRVKGGDFLSWKHFSSGAWIANPAALILLILGFSVVGFAFLFIVLPLMLHRGKGGKGGKVKRSAGTLPFRSTSLVYFALIGLAFIFVEIAFLQKFSLFLGHPAYSLLVVLFSLLITTAFGARLGGMIPDPSGGRSALLCGFGLAVLCALYAMVLGPALTAWLAWPLPARMALAAFLIGITGLLMGVMLPSGIRILTRRDDGIIPWAWGVNGATSVIGTVAATMLALNVGFTKTLLTGCAMYALAGLTAWVIPRVGRGGIS